MHNLIYDFFGFNKASFIFINKITNISIIPDILEVISQFFSIEKFAIYYFIACIYCYFKLKKQLDPKIKFFPIYNKLVQVGVCYALFGFTYAALKFGINLPRPFCSLNSEEFTTILDVTKERCLSSFPSAHVGLSIIIAYHLWLYFKQYQKIIMCLLILAVGVSRITLAMHYPADILYSVIIVFGLIFFSNRLVGYLQDKIINPIGRFIIKLIFA